MDEPKAGDIYLNDLPVKRRGEGIGGAFLRFQGEDFYRIRAYDMMPPFLMNIVSSSDLWMFLSSSGGITAGRRSPDAALFPYYSDDRLAENSGNTGPLTIVRAEAGGRLRLWEPFSCRHAGLYDITRSLYKNLLGTCVVFEEVNRDLGLTFGYGWTSCDRYGIVRTSRLTNHGRAAIAGEILDGLQNILPYGVTAATQAKLSNLLDAYKRSELDPETGVAVYALSSALTDLAEPSESLLATRVFRCGLPRATVLLSAAQVDRFREGKAVEEERDVRGRRGAYLAARAFDLEPGASGTWKLVADVEQDARRIVSIANLAGKDPAGLTAAVEKDIRESDRALLRIVAGADGLQATGDEVSSAHHFSNVLFNILRGGTFTAGYTLERADLLDFIAVRNRKVLEEGRDFFASLPATIGLRELMARAAGTGRPDLERLCTEYLPLACSRRHGDPSRPWNSFSINIRKPGGGRCYDYQGNWRDIFQNWEALAFSYPYYLEGMIYRFLNATTADGYNPYRITRDGLEWEIPNPDNPWANIGYWGDHQIIYLLKLLETCERFFPGRLAALLNKKVFSYANVPYRIREYERILENWYDTIIFDHELQRRTEREAEKLGSDACLLHDRAGRVLHVTLLEKLLVLLLAKLANLVPGGGIWMNTQRPEWNDANNALAGKGLSVVTAGYLRRFVAFLKSILAARSGEEFAVSGEVAQFLDAVQDVLVKHEPALGSRFDDRRRRRVMDALGSAAGAYRWGIYRNGLSGSSAGLAAGRLLNFLDLARRYIEQTLRANRRVDGLYHAYNTLSLKPGAAGIEHLVEMLEGQVAILSSGLLSAKESLELLTALRESRMYRADQHSYLLYPDRDLPGFLEKNVAPKEKVERLALMRELIRKGDESLVVRDENGAYRFNGRFRNRKDVAAALASLEAGYPDLVASEREAVLALFESVFRHNAFTGRSGTFFAYEGLGSVYWHMVSKLLLAVQETLLRAVDDGEEKRTLEALRERYYDIRKGLGFNKSPGACGAFPTEPYSHTPAGRGAQQPGMTGQVKEEILTRMHELGLRIARGRIGFDPVLLRPEELAAEPRELTCITADGTGLSVEVPAGALAFTFCQVPVVVRPSERVRMEASLASGDSVVFEGRRLDREHSGHIFARDGYVRMLRIEPDREISPPA